MRRAVESGFTPKMAEKFLVCILIYQLANEGDQNSGEAGVPARSALDDENGAIE